MTAELGLVLPLYDEEEVVEGVVRDHHRALAAAGLPARMVLVDNGSRDATGRIVDALAAELVGVQALHLPANAGYGGGILAGMALLDEPVVGWTWGDGQVAPEVVVRCHERLVDEGLDLCKACRTVRQDGLQRRVVTRAYNAAAHLLFRPGTRDVNGCPKLFRLAAWRRLAPRSRDWFLDPEVVLLAREAGLRLGEVEAVMRPRAAGASKVRGRTALQFVHHLLAWRLLGWRP